MRFMVCVFCLSLLGVPLGVRAAEQNSPSSQPPTTSTAPQPQEQRIDVSQTSQAQLRTLAGEPGYMDPEAMKQLLHKVWLAEYRINDLLTEVHPERWKLEDATQASFLKTLETLRTQMDNLEQWRAQFDKRPDSMYLGYQTYAAINTLLPRLEGIGRDVARHENPSLGRQFSQPGNQLFDLQQAIEPFLSFLLRNQDQLLSVTQNNLASCQNELSSAMRGRTEPAQPMKNILPEFKGRRRSKSQPAATTSQPPGQSKSGEKAKPETKSPVKTAVRPVPPPKAEKRQASAPMSPQKPAAPATARK